MARTGFLKHAAVYAVGDLLLMAAGFILVPLYARWLSPAEFGSLELLDRVGEVAAICLLGRGLPLATIAFTKQSTDESRRQAVAAAFLLGLGGLGAGAGVLAVAARPLEAALGVDNRDLLWFAVGAALLECLVTVALAANQARLESGYYVVTSVAQFVFRVVLCIVFVVGLGWGVWGIVLASLLRSGAFGVALAVREWRRGLAWPNGATVRDMLAFVVPFVPTGLCFFVLNSGDRFFLVRGAGQEAVGVYGIGYKVALLAGLFSITPLNRVWSARIYEVAETEGAAEAFGRTASRILGAYLFVGLGLSLLDHEVIHVFAGASFAAATLVVAPVVAAYGFQAASVLMEAGFYVRRQTRWKPLIAAASTVIMLALYAALIPPLGVLGAALATLVGFICHATITLSVTQRIMPVKYEYRRLLGMAGLALVLWLVSRLLEPGLPSVPIKAVLWLLWPVLLVAAGLIAPEEIQFARALLGQCLGRGRHTGEDPAPAPPEAAAPSLSELPAVSS